MIGIILQYRIEYHFLELYFHGRVASVDDLVRRVVFVETNRQNFAVIDTN